MTKDNEQYAYFTVTGDFDPASITARVHLEPTEQWVKGSRNERTCLERKFSRWSLESRLERSVPLKDHVRDVLDQTLRSAEEITKISKEHAAYMQLVGWFYNDYPGFELDESIISGLAQLNVGIDCDFYYLYSDRREDS